MTVELKRSTPIEFSYLNALGETITFTAPACTVGGYRDALRLEAESASSIEHQASSEKLLNQAVALCGEHNRHHLESMDIEMIQEVIQAQVALYSGLDPAAALEVMRGVKKKALTTAVHAISSSASTAS